MLQSPEARRKVSRVALVLLVFMIAVLIASFIGLNK